MLARSNEMVTTTSENNLKLLFNLKMQKPVVIKGIQTKFPMVTVENIRDLIDLSDLSYDSNDVFAKPLVLPISKESNKKLSSLRSPSQRKQRFLKRIIEKKLKKMSPEELAFDHLDSFHLANIQHGPRPTSPSMSVDSGIDLSHDSCQIPLSKLWNKQSIKSESCCKNWHVENGTLSHSNGGSCKIGKVPEECRRTEIKDSFCSNVTVTLQNINHKKKNEVVTESGVKQEGFGAEVFYLHRSNEASPTQFKCFSKEPHQKRVKLARTNSFMDFSKKDNCVTGTNHIHINNKPKISSQTIHSPSQLLKKFDKSIPIQIEEVNHNQSVTSDKKFMSNFCELNECVTEKSNFVSKLPRNRGICQEKSRGNSLDIHCFKNSRQTYDTNLILNELCTSEITSCNSFSLNRDSSTSQKYLNKDCNAELGNQNSSYKEISKVYSERNGEVTNFNSRTALVDKKENLEKKFSRCLQSNEDTIEIVKGSARTNGLSAYTRKALFVQSHKIEEGCAIRTTKRIIDNNNCVNYFDYEFNSSEENHTEPEKDISSDIESYLSTNDSFFEDGPSKHGCKLQGEVSVSQVTNDEYLPLDISEEIEIILIREKEHDAEKLSESAVDILRSTSLGLLKSKKQS